MIMNIMMDEIDIYRHDYANIKENTFTFSSYNYWHTKLSRALSFNINLSILKQQCLKQIPF